MPKKKKFKLPNNNMVYILVGAVVIMAMGKTQPISSPDAVTDISVLNMLNNPLDYQTGECTFQIKWSPANWGDMVTGKVTADPMQDCKAYYRFNQGEWIYFISFTTNSAGIYDESTRMTQPGHYEFAAICDQCLTNYATLSVRQPNTSQDSDGDGWTDWDEVQQGTDPFDPNDNPGTNPPTGDCNTFCLGEPGGYTGGRQVSSGSQCVATLEVARDMGSDVCCCYLPTIPDCNIYCVNNGYLLGRGPFSSNSFCDAMYEDHLRYVHDEWCCCARMGGTTTTTSGTTTTTSDDDPTTTTSTSSTTTTTSGDPDEQCEYDCYDKGYQWGGYAGQCQGTYSDEYYWNDINCCCVLTL